MLWYNKVTNCATEQEVLGFVLNTEATPIFLLERKVPDLREEMNSWPATRTERW